MAKLPIRHLRKRRTRGHAIADLNENYLERQVLLCGFSVKRRSIDYGIDLVVETYNRRGEVENGRINFQVKASDRTSFSADGRSVLCRIDKADLLYWLGESKTVERNGYPPGILLEHSPSDTIFIFRRCADNERSTWPTSFRSVNNSTCVACFPRKHAIVF